MYRRSHITRYLLCFRLGRSPVCPKLLVRFYSDASYHFTFLRLSVGVEKCEVRGLFQAGYLGFLWSINGVPTLKRI